MLVSDCYDCLNASNSFWQTHSCEEIAKVMYQHNNALYLGRGIHYDALEGALKLKRYRTSTRKDIAGEMKHGPNALIDHNLPVIALAKDSRHPKSLLRYEK
jgi:glucosamine--fructose-6-phosphate aminotransferase (isomerizing)